MALSITKTSSGSVKFDYGAGNVSYYNNLQGINIQVDGSTVNVSHSRGNIPIALSSVSTINGVAAPATGLLLADVLGTTVFNFGGGSGGGATSASNITTGTLSNDRLSDEVAGIDRVGTPGLGLEVGAPVSTSTASIALINQRTLFVYFKVDRRITVNSIAMASDNTAAGATPTLVRFGLYAMSEDNEVYPLARSVNDTSIFSVVATRYTKSFADGWASSVTLVPNRNYAVALAINSAGAMPLVVAHPATRTVLQNATMSKRTGASTDLPLIYGDSGNAWNNWFQTPWVLLGVGGALNIAKSSVLLGDSFFATYGDWFGLGNAQGGARLHPINNAGVGGETIAQVLARWDAEVTPFNPEWVPFHAGTNDLHSEGATSAVIISRYQQVIAKAQLDGRKLILFTPPPNSASSAQAKTYLTEVRTYLLGLNITGVLVCDTGMALSTGDGVTSDPTKVVDTVHPNDAGFAAMAPVLAATEALIV